MKPEDIKFTLEKHALWLRSEPGGIRADLSGADLSGADLSGANLRSADLSGANLRITDLRSANLRSANLSGAYLRSADLSGANLRSADLSGANLRSADLSGADLRSADLSGADLRSADLRSADLSGADLSESIGVKFAQCSWTGYGERGRQLLAVELSDGLRLFCGCFQGLPNDLAAYIANGAKEHRESRTKAMQFVLSCF